MALVESLLSAIVRADGDALVMHVGERPYVVVGTQTINISTHGLNLDAMTGMLTQLLPGDSHTQLEEFGAVEYRIPPRGDDRFTVVAARGGDDIWIEIRRRRPPPTVAAVVATPKPDAAPIAESGVNGETPVQHVEPVSHVDTPVADTQARHAGILNAQPEPLTVAVQHQAQPESISEPVTGPAVMPVGDRESQLGSFMAEVVAPDAEALTQPIDQADAAVTPQPAVAGQAHAANPFAELEAYVEAAPESAASEVVAAPHTQPEMAAPKSGPVPAAVPMAASTREWEPASEPTPTAAPVPEPEPAPEPVSVAASIPEGEPAPLPIAASTPEPAPEPIPIAASIPEPEPVTLLTAASIELPPQMHPGVVVPMTRTVRIEVPPRTSTRSASSVDRLLRIAAAGGASALFLTSDSRPWMRMDGDLRNLDAEAPLSRADVEAAILEIAPESAHESIGKGEPTEWIADFPEVGRVRCTTFSDHRGPGVLLRIISTRTATAEQLGLAREVQALATEAQGLVLVAGPRASGKSTLISALLDLVNRQRADFVITLERQIRLVHDHKLALVSQREIRGGAEESVAATRAALRESPDVLVVDDLVSPQMVPLLLTAASEGLLVFVSVTASSTADAVQRFVELAAPEMRKAVQNAMAESFRGAVAQVMLKKAAGGVIAAREVLLASGPVTRLIGEGQLDRLPLTLEAGRDHGMVSSTDALVEYVRAGTVDLREAFRKAPDRSRLLERLKHEGIDTSVVERLA